MRVFRHFSHFILVVGCMFASAASSAPSIRVQAGDWGAAGVDDIGAVLGSVAEVLLPDFPKYASVHIEVRPSRAGPRVLEEKTAEGAYQVELDVRDARWDQFAYQFSHELCHIVSNYDHRALGSAAVRPHQWLEETLCEVVSIVTLERLASRWQGASPYPGWASYAPAFTRYAQRLLGAEHRNLPAHTSLIAWYRENRHSLESNPYLRTQNELAASALLDLFQTPGGLRAIGYLNLESPAREDLASYLAAWRECCPESHQPQVERLISLLGA